MIPDEIIYTDAPETIEPVSYNYPHALFTAAAFTCVVSGFLLAVCVMTVWHYKKLSDRVNRGTRQASIIYEASTTTLINVSGSSRVTSEDEITNQEHSIQYMINIQQSEALNSERGLIQDSGFNHSNASSRVSTLSRFASLDCCGGPCYTDLDNKSSSRSLEDLSTSKGSLNLSKYPSFSTDRSDMT